MAFAVTDVPLYPDAFYRYSLNLEGRQRSMSFYWNERAGAWHFDVKNSDGTAVLLGQKLVAQHPIAADYRLDSFGMTGYFLLLPSNLGVKVDVTDSSVIPQFFKLYYIYELTG